MLFIPELVALAGVGMFLLLLLVAPVQAITPLDMGALSYIGLSYLGFFAGCLFIRGVINQRGVRPPRFWIPSHTLFWGTAMVGAMGMGLRLVDKIFLRGVDLAASALESREMMADAQAGPVAAVAGTLFPFCYIPLMLLWAMRRHQPVSLWTKLVATGLFLAPALDALLLLSRSQMLVAMAMMYFAVACVLFQGRAAHPRLITPVLLGVVVVVSLSAGAFFLRLGEMELDIVVSILNSAYAYTLEPTQKALIGLRSYSDTARLGYGAGLPLLMYYIHGLFEFSVQWTRPDVQIHSYGVLHFAPYFKMLAMAGGPDLQGVFQQPLFLREGVFTMFFGPLWVDFGWFGPLFLALFGALATAVAHSVQQGEAALAPLHSYFAVVIFFMPVVNFMVSAQGMYIINAFALFAVVAMLNRQAT